MSTTGVSALGPPDFQGPPNAPTPRDAAVLFQPLTLPPLSRFQGGQADRLTHVQVPLTWNLSSSPSKFSFEYLLLPPRSAPTAAPPARASRFCSDRRASYSSRPGSAPTAGIELASELQLSRGNFGGNQLLDGSISLSPLYPSQTNDLHARSLRPPPEFLWLRPARHSSPSFGPDRHAHTRTLLVRSRSVGSAPVRDPTNQLPYALRVYSPADSHTCQTPWSVFQDGSNGEPTGRRPSTQMPRHAVRRVLQTTIKAATPPLAQRRGATGSGTTGSHLSGAPFQGTWARSVAEDAPDYTNAKTPDFQAGLFPFAVTKGILLPPHILERMGTTICDTQADVPRQKAWGATCAQRLDGSRILHHTKYRFRHALHRCEPRYPLPSRFRLYIAALLPTNTASGWRKQHRLVACSSTLFVPGLVKSEAMRTIRPRPK
ncbi:hypothetical protein Bca4012_103133 [Brassica carinata]